MNLSRIDTLLSLGKLVCTKCRSSEVQRQGEARLSCDSCGAAFRIQHGVPVFEEWEGESSQPPLPAPAALSALEEKKKVGFAESLFSSPRAYRRLVDFKHWLYADATLGVAEFVNGQEVLDVGCGPAVEGYWGEYDPSKAASYTGIDLSVNFAVKASQATPFPSTFVAGSATKLPFADQSFDTSILGFTLHHVAEPPEELMREVLRVTRKWIVIFDHLAHDWSVPRAIQNLYWRNMDGGFHYLQKGAWDALLASCETEKELRTGAIFGHVLKKVVRLNQSAKSGGAR